MNKMFEKISKIHSIRNDDINTPAMSLDMKRKRIRIHKSTLHILNDPDYIQLLINPEEYIMIIQSSSSADHLSHKINWLSISENQCCELHSKNLIIRLSEVFPFLDCETTFRVNGNYIQEYNLVYFNLKECNCISVSEGKHHE